MNEVYIHYVTLFLESREGEGAYIAHGNLLLTNLKKEKNVLMHSILWGMRVGLGVRVLWRIRILYINMASLIFRTKLFILFFIRTCTPTVVHEKSKIHSFGYLYLESLNNTTIWLEVKRVSPIPKYPIPSLKLYLLNHRTYAILV